MGNREDKLRDIYELRTNGIKIVEGTKKECIKEYNKRLGGFTDSIIRKRVMDRMYLTKKQ